MKLTAKTLLALGFTTLALLVILAASWSGLIMSSYAAFESRDAQRDVERARAALTERISFLDNKMSDWAAWGATCEFMEGTNPGWVEDNLPGPVTLQDMELHVMAAVHPDGRFAWTGARPWQDGAGLSWSELPKSLLPHLEVGTPLGSHTSVDAHTFGIVLLPEGPLLMASRPIITGEHEGPIRGALTWGRFLTAAEITDLAAVTRLDLDVRRVDATDLTPAMAEALDLLMGLEEGAMDIRPLSESLVVGSTLLRDVYGKPALLLQVRAPRTFHLQGLEHVRTSSYFLAGAGVVFCLVSMALLRGIVLRRLERLSRNLRAVGRSGDLSGRVRVEGKDELAELAMAVNRMLDALHRSQAELREQEALRRSEERYRALVETSPTPVFISSGGRVLYLNAAAATLLDREVCAAPDDLTLRDLLPEAQAEVLEVADGGEATRMEGQLRVAGDALIEVELTFSGLEFQGQMATQVVVHDIRERKRSENQLRHLAYHDALTGLPNRRYFNGLLEEAIVRAERARHQVLVMVLDLDRFKWVNDTLGHEMGDQLLKVVAERLRHAVRASDTVARVGGDEFFLICPQLSSGVDALSMAQRVLDLFSDPITLGEHHLYVAPSIGLALYPEDGDDADALTRHADMAMYRAKGSGGNGFQTFEAEMSHALQERREIEEHLRHALSRGELHLVYQPQVEISSHRIVAAEALLRWECPALGGNIPPSRFIPIAEETGLIIPFTEWILREVCGQVRRWQDAGLPPLRVAVNLSALHFHVSRSEGMIRLVEAALAEFDLSPRWLELEITESAAMHNLDHTAAVLGRLHDLGVHLALDDFGTGYSMLGYLKKFPIQAIKIDRTFIRDVHLSADGRAIVQAVLALCQALGVSSVAEGVEAVEELELLAEHQCTLVQGYLFSRPQAPVRLAELLARGYIDLEGRVARPLPLPLIA